MQTNQGTKVSLLYATYQIRLQGDIPASSLQIRANEESLHEFASEGFAYLKQIATIPNLKETDNETIVLRLNKERSNIARL